MQMRSCPICGTLLCRRFGERTYEFFRRQTCDRHCAAALGLKRRSGEEWAWQVRPRETLEAALFRRGLLDNVAVAMGAAHLWRRQGIGVALAFVASLPEGGGGE